MGLDEAMKCMVTREEAIREIRLHNLDPAEFFQEMGNRAEYTGASVLQWLGY